MSITMDFGTNLTQEELAECLNTSPQTVSKWENNLSMPDITVLPLMADFFGTSLDSLLLHNSSQRKQEMKEFASLIHELADTGNMAQAYET